jgi:hypothetical protein
MGKMRQNINVEPVLFNAEQVQAYLGGNFGLNTITELMKSDTIPTVQSGSKRLLLTRKADVDEFVEYLFRKPVKNKSLDTYPTKLLKEIK